jgi:hypothetical protein
MEKLEALRKIRRIELYVDCFGKKSNKAQANAERMFFHIERALEFEAMFEEKS